MTDLGNGLVAIAVPKNAYDFEFMYDSLYYITHPKQEFEDDVFIGKGDFKILGTVTATDISFDVEPYVERDSSISFKDYVGDKWPFPNPNGSFRSLLASKGLYFENPNGEYNKFRSDIRESDWKQAQQNIVQKLVILKRTP